MPQRLFRMTKKTETVKQAIRTAAMTFSIARLTGGLYFSVEGICKALLNENVSSDVIALEGGWGEHLSQEELDHWKPLSLCIVPCSWPRKLGYSPRLLSALKEIAPSIVHIHGLWHYQSVAARKYCRQNRIPFVVSSHGMLDHWALRNKGWKKCMASWVYHDAAMKSAFCIRALCDAEVNAIRKSGFKNPVCVIPNGVELPNEAPDVKLHSQADGWAIGKRILLFLGRIAPKKGLINLILAWSKVRTEAAKLADDWVLVIAGMDEGGHEAEIRHIVEDLDLGRNVLLLGPQYGPAKTSLFYSASAFILPSYSEGLPMGILDAWAHGLPVLMTPQCNLQEGVTAGAAIHIVPTTEGIERGLLQMFEMSTGQLAGMGRNGRCLVSERFTWARVGSQMREVYDWMLGGGSLPACVQSTPCPLQT